MDKPERSLVPAWRSAHWAAGHVRDWRRSFEDTFPIDAWDPLARLIRSLHWDWVQVWFVAFLIYGPIEKLLLPALGGYLTLTGDLHTWRPDIEALLTGFVEFPFFFAFYVWSSHGISDLFVSLAQNNSFRDGERYHSFYEQVSRSFDRWWWTALSFGLALIAVALMHWVMWRPDAPLPPWFGSERVYPRVVSLFLIFWVAYAVAQVVIRELLAGFWLRRLWRDIGDDLVVHPYHADGAGGLGAIGRHVVNLSYFILMIMLFIVMGSLLPSLRTPGQLSPSLWSPLLALVWMLYFTFVPAIFYLLIWTPHCTMRQVRIERLNTIGAQLEAQLDAAEANAKGDQADLSERLKKLQDLKGVQTLLQEDLPTWPLNRRLWRRLSLSSLLPVLSTVLTLVLEFLT